MLRLKTILLAKIDQNGSKYMLQKNKILFQINAVLTFFSELTYLHLHLVINRCFSPRRGQRKQSKPTKEQCKCYNKSQLA